MEDASIQSQSREYLDGVEMKGVNITNGTGVTRWSW